MTSNTIVDSSVYLFGPLTKDLFCKYSIRMPVVWNFFRTLSLRNLLVLGAFIFLVAALLYKPFINAMYPSDKKTHDVEKITEGKVRIVQYRDILQGEKDPDSKVVMHIFPDKKKINLTVNEKGVWQYPIDQSLKTGNHNLLVVYSDQQDVVERTRIYKIKIVENREFYKKKKKITSKTQTKDDTEEERKTCTKYEFFSCGSCDEEVYACQDGINVVKIKNPAGECGTQSVACGASPASQ